ncbi:MAG: DUF502 domain-containing protein [Phycisphaerae bacterium]|nr:DUF502 domain-containing protein [Phycisphaerae bacterium]
MSARRTPPETSRMDIEQPKTPREYSPRRSSVLGALKVLLRTRISAGVITVIPVVVTIWLVLLIFGLIKNTTQRAVEAYLLSNTETPTGMVTLESLHFDLEGYEALKAKRERVGMNINRDEFFDFFPWHVRWGIPVFSVLLTMFLLYLIGLFTANLIGRRMINTAESMLDQVPLIKTVYRAIKQILHSLSGDQSQNFQRVALIPFPQERMRCVGFITSIFRDSITDEELATVFIPTTPNPTTGYLQILRRKELVELDWSVEEAVRTIMSGGILRPDFLTIVPNSDKRHIEALKANPELTAPKNEGDQPV